MIQHMASRYQTQFAVVRGCRVNLRNSTGSFVSKGWKLMTTSPLMASRMNMPCQCAQSTVHVPCEGPLTKKSAFYTREFARRVCETILQGDTKVTLCDEFQGRLKGSDLFGKGSICVCDEHRVHGSEVTCGHCRVSLSEAMAADHPPAPCSLSPDQIQQRLHLLHSATGHSPVRYMVQALRRRGVHADILKAAQQFRCSTCEERARPNPRNLSALEPQPPKFDTISSDVGHMVHPHTGEHFQFLVVVDEGSRFKVSRVVLKGKKKHLSAAQFITTLKEAWCSYFGTPRVLRLDPDGAFRSRELSEFCDQHHIYLDLIPGEAHWKLGVCERSLQSIKAILIKVLTTHPDSTPEDALAESVRALNCREVIRGYSPLQHVIGRAPDDTGRFFTTDSTASPDILSESPAQGHQRSEELRLTAEKAFLDWNSADRMTRALNSRHRRVLDFSAGDLVFIWRRQVTGKDAKPSNDTQGRFVGPARILATEQHKDTQGHLVPGSSVWLVRGRRLLKCCPEQLRHASEKEQLIEDLHADEPQAWDFPRVADELGGNEYEDWSETPPEQEWLRASDPQHEWQPTVRQWGKRGRPPDPREEPVTIGPEGPESSRWRPAPPGARAGRSRSPIPRVANREETSLERLARDKAEDYRPSPHSQQDHTHTGPEAEDQSHP